MTVGVVVIGRNEGERLRRCLLSVVGQVETVVYVDSGSADGSVALARSFGVATLDLDMSIPFTAARARNAGIAMLRQNWPGLAYVQFVDGDCELAPGWLSAATAFLEERTDVAMVCGRLRERNSSGSVYNLLCDIEWDAPPGESRACGGNAMARIAALSTTGGYREALIAGEEPELCLRLRTLGWKVWRLPDEMAWHDAAMTRFGQWWRRAMRGGYAFAEGAYMHGDSPERHGVAESRRIWLWAAVLPAFVLVTVQLTGPWGLVPLALYPLQVARLARRGRRSASENLAWALFNVLGKFPQLIGQLRFHSSRLAAGEARLIEYK
jgi:GT2 family glycosyltransferase